MADALVLATRQVAPISEPARAALGEALANGLGIVGGMATPSPAFNDDLDRRSRFLFRRWLLEILLLLRVGGSAKGFNQVRAGLGSPHSESLAEKLRDLEAAGLVLRSDLGGAPRRVAYRLTPAGNDLAVGVFALTHGKALHHGMLAGIEQLPAASPRRGDLPALVGGFVDATRRFEAAHQSTSSPGEDPWATARRFSQTCVHKWHGAILGMLAGGKSWRFGELKAVLGTGDEALSRALRQLLGLRCISKSAADSRAYEITVAGRFDAALGAPLLFLLPGGRAPRSTPSDVPLLEGPPPYREI